MKKDSKKINTQIYFHFQYFTLLGLIAPQILKKIYLARVLERPSLSQSPISVVFIELPLATPRPLNISI